LSFDWTVLIFREEWKLLISSLSSFFPFSLPLSLRCKHSQNSDTISEVTMRTTIIRDVIHRRTPRYIPEDASRFEVFTVMQIHHVHTQQRNMSRPRWHHATVEEMMKIVFSVGPLRGYITRPTEFSLVSGVESNWVESRQLWDSRQPVRTWALKQKTP
jgi:hypothetical protein